jgi:sec-independent protein translocase protein TatB
MTFPVVIIGAVAYLDFQRGLF